VTSSGGPINEFGACEKKQEPFHPILKKHRRKYASYEKLSDSLTQGHQTFLSEGHIRYYTTLLGPDFLHNVIVSGYVTF